MPKPIGADADGPKIKVRTYSATEVSAMYEVLVWLKRKEKINEEAINFFHSEMANMPHEHVMSLIGPYCYVCHVDLPY